MSITVQHLQENTHLIVVNGRLDYTQSNKLENELSQLQATTPTYFIVDLTKTTYINSGGLRSLVSAWRRAREAEGDLLLCGLSDKLMHIFKMVGFDKVFQIYPSQNDAKTALIS